MKDTKKSDEENGDTMVLVANNLNTPQSDNRSAFDLIKSMLITLSLYVSYAFRVNSLYLEVRARTPF